MVRNVPAYPRVQVLQEAWYAGNRFKTKGSQDAVHSKTDDSNVRYEYMNSDGRTVTIYGTIVRIFEHTMYPDGTVRTTVACPSYSYGNLCN